jgi:predicted AAA+ superfamily ATPase
MIQRDLAPRVLAAARSFPAVTITGPRQSGKSTLCRALFANHPYVSLEAPDVRRFATEDPRAFLGRYPRGAVLDELQRVPELTSYLQPLIDEDPRPGRWILTGSQNFALLQSTSQSLAGRTAILHLLPLSHDEVRRFPGPPDSLDEALLAGGYPRIFDQGIPPSDWLSAYVATYVERDVRLVSNISDLAAFQRFLALCAGRTGQLVNYSSLAADAGVSQPTAKAWLSILEASFIAFRLPAWSGSVRKRLVKMPKLHFYDSGLACWLLGIRSVDHLRDHPLRGAIFESWVVAEVAKHRANAGERGGLWFYRDSNGVEADLLVEGPSGLKVIEAKAGQTVTSGLLGPGLRVVEAIGPAADPTPRVVYAGEETQRRSACQLVPWHSISDLPGRSTG